MSKKLKIALFVGLVILISSLTMGGYETVKEKKGQFKEDLYNQVELFSDGVSVIRNEYVEEADPKKIIYGALKGMLSSLDDFSQFMDPEEYKELKIDATGQFGGIGVEISTKEGIITIITPLSGTPADKAGVKAGDKIVRINGKSTKDMTLSGAVKIMRGDPGTQLVLTVWREKDQKALDISIKRAIIRIDSIKDAHIIEDRIGYIKLIEFQDKAARELDDAIKKLDTEGMDSLILDLRNNPGGLLESAVAVSERFLPKDEVIVSTKSRDPSQNMAFKSSGKFYHRDYPIVALVNEGSASASEIVAGALQDDKRAVILGTKTFGKGCVQTVVPLKDGSALKLTTATYYTPSGKSITDQGVIPDVVVEREEMKKAKRSAADVFEEVEKSEENRKEKKEEKKSEKAQETLEKDNQLQSAVNLIKAIKVYRGKS